MVDPESIFSQLFGGERFQVSARRQWTKTPLRFGAPS